MVNSRNKGAKGERELAAELTKVFGATARRGQQFCGGAESPDVVHNIDGLHLEVKRTERLNLYAAIDQATRDAGENTPVVCHRKNRREWVVIMKLDDVIKFVKTINQYFERDNDGS